STPSGQRVASSLHVTAKTLVGISGLPLLRRDRSANARAQRKVNRVFVVDRNIGRESDCWPATGDHRVDGHAKLRNPMPLVARIVPLPFGAIDGSVLHCARK